MIIGFLGKGGSGKTSLATLFTKYLIDKNNFLKDEEVFKDGNKVLALDNDHNMDFKFNLGFEEEMNYIGQSLEEIFETIAIKATKDVANVQDEDYYFNLSPLDDLTKKYSVKLKENLFLMVSGPHTDDMMYGNRCSHALTTPLKVYLPLLKLRDGEYVIVDEKAGTDGVGTGVTTGFNLAVVVAEATVHGVKSAKQIIKMLHFYNTPYVILINKIRDEKLVNIYKNEFEDTKALGILFFKLDFAMLDLDLNEDFKKEFEKLFNIIKSLSDDRKERTRERIKKQEDFNKLNK